jgi:hypothetical protein
MYSKKIKEAEIHVCVHIVHSKKAMSVAKYKAQTFDYTPIFVKP